MIRLAPITQAHFEQIAKWASDPEMAEYFRRFPPAFTWCHPSTFLAAMQGMFLICNDDECLGLLSLNNFDAQNRKAELGIMLEPGQGRRANAADAAVQAGEYLFDHLGYNKAYCLTLSHREDIGKLLCSFGFQKEGTLKQNIFWQGSFHDEDLYGMTAETFRRI